MLRILILKQSAGNILVGFSGRNYSVHVLSSVIWLEGFPSYTSPDRWLNLRAAPRVWCGECLTQWGGTGLLLSLKRGGVGPGVAVEEKGLSKSRLRWLIAFHLYIGHIFTQGFILFLLSSVIISLNFPFLKKKIFFSILGSVLGICDLVGNHSFPLCFQICCCTVACGINSFILNVYFNLLYLQSCLLSHFQTCIILFFLSFPFS